MKFRLLSPRRSAVPGFFAFLTAGALAAVTASTAAPRTGYAVPASLHPQPADAPAPTVALNTIYSFSVPDAETHANADGAQPSALVPDGQGNFLGTAYAGGAAGNGTVFEVSANGTFTTLHSFSATTYDSETQIATNADGATPAAALVADGQGGFYGTTIYGGAGGNGTVFKITTDGTAAGTTLTTLHSFSVVVSDGNGHTSNADGATPESALVSDGQGSLYGTTYGGGDNNHGVVFKISTDGATFTTLHSFSLSTVNQNTGIFTNADGTYPQAALVADGQGNFLGSTTTGGLNGHGTLFEVTPAGVFTPLYSFSASGNVDGTSPSNALTADGLGNFYGVTSGGGVSGEGVVFKVVTDGTAAGTTLTLLHSFSATTLVGPQTYTNTDGAVPSAPLIYGLDGNLYGDTRFGGSGGEGTLFQITPAGVLQPLYNFTAGADGAQPVGALLQTDSATFYGVTAQTADTGTGSQSTTDYGTIFHLNVIPAAGEIGFGGSTTTFNENAGTAQVTVSRTGGSTGAVSVSYATADGTATAGTDYTATSGTLTWADGDATDKSIAVPLIDRHLLSGSSTFLVTLGAPTGGAILLNATGASLSEQLTILDDDTVPQPVITSAATASVQTGQAFTYQITASNSPTGFAATGLPTGLSVDPTSGLITGTAPAVGTYPITLSASNAGGTGTGTLTLTVTATPVAPPAVTSATTASGQVGVSFTYQITASNSPTGFAATGLPTGLSVDPTSGLITGTPTGAGTFPVTLSASNAGGTGTGALTLTITAPVVTTAPSVEVTSPPAGITLVVGETVPLAASVGSDGTLASLQFLANGKVVGTVTAGSPYRTSTVVAAPGPYAFTAVAIDPQGHTNSSTVNVTVVAADPANPPPVVGLLTPVDGRDLASDATLTVTATAHSDSTGGLDHVTFYTDGTAFASFGADGSPLAASAGSPTGGVHRRDASTTPLSQIFSTAFTMPGLDKILTLLVTATDKLGHTSISSVVNFHSKVTTDRAPKVAFTNAGALAKVPVGKTQTAQVSASDPDAATNAGFVRQDTTGDAQLAELEYFINGVSIGQATTPPFTFAFTPPSSGKYVLHAVATDGSGLATVSDPVVLEADPLPVVTAVTGGDGMAVEGGENGKVRVIRTGDTTLPLTVRYKVKGSAQAGVDYKPVTGMVTIPAGAVQAKVKIKPIDNTTPDGIRVAKVKLLPSLDGSYSLGSAVVGKVNIIDNDQPSLQP